MSASATTLRGLLLAACAVQSASSPRAQCGSWDRRFRALGIDGEVNAQAVFDDGTGPALYLGLEPVFSSNPTMSAGGVPVEHIARWDGESWSPVGEGLDGPVHALGVFDDGGGPALYAGGEFLEAGGLPAARIARWDGTRWSELGSGLNGFASSLAVHDDGTGAALYVGGHFTLAGGVDVLGLARWDGEAWSAVGGGPGLGVSSMATFDAGAGRLLYATGTFGGGTLDLADGIAAWDGQAWVSLGSGLDGAGHALALWDDGSGPRLVVGGDFFHADGKDCARIAAWNGASFSPLGMPGDGMDDAIDALLVHDDGSGSALFAAGEFHLAGGTAASGVAKWDGSSWSAVGTGITDFWPDVRSLGSFDGGGGSVLVAAGELHHAGASALNDVGAWDGTQWRAIDASAATNGVNGPVRALAAIDDGSGRRLYASGTFSSAGDQAAWYDASWDGTAWATLGLPYVTPSYDFELHAGAVHVATHFGVRRKEGVTWAVIGQSNREVFALASVDLGSGPSLYAAGEFDTMGSLVAGGIARWNGVGWSALDGGMNAGALSLASFDDGGGTDLYVGGAFTTSGGVTTNHVARWDGMSWSSLGSGTDGSVRALAVHDDGTGMALYAAGNFTSAGGEPANHVARWNGSAWTPLGSGLDDLVMDLEVFDDGEGPRLYAAGDFTQSGAWIVRYLAKWDGVRWKEVDPTLDRKVHALAVYDDGLGGGPDLYAGGYFQTAGGELSSYIARWDGCYEPGEPMCFGDGSLAPCPCGNPGDAGFGCQNSAATGGAHLLAAGSTHPDTIGLHATRELPTALTIFLQGDVTLAPLGFGDGLRCAGGALKRLYVRSASGGAASAPAPSDLPITARSAALGDPILPGETRTYQTYYRDANPTFCPSPPGNTFNSSNGVRILW